MNLEHYRQRLLTLERELLERVGNNIDVSRAEGDDQFDPGDIGRVSELKDEYLALAENDTGVLGQVRAALERIDNDTYGRCVVDGQPIDEKRLESVPWAPYCLKHQQEIEERAGVRTPKL